MIRLIKRFRYAESSYAALLVGLVLGFLLWFASFAGLFTVPDGVLYDHLSASTVSFAGNQSGVLLLEVEPEIRDSGDETWTPLLKELQAQGAAQIVFAFMPSGVSRDFYNASNQTGQIIFGRRLVSNAGGVSDALEMEPLPPAAAQSQGLQTAVYALAASEYGVYRSQAHAFSINNGQNRPVSLEEMASVLRAGKTITRNSSTFMVNFLGGSSGLPRISAKRVLNGELIPELVKGRSVLIGTRDSGQLLFTPLAASGKLLSELEFHGYALDTLLRERNIWQLPLWLEFPLILILVGVSLFGFQWGGLRFSAVFTGVLFVTYTLLAWVALHFGRVWLPLAELWIAQIVTFLVFTRYRAVNEETRLRQLLQETNAKLREHFFPASFITSPEHWAQVITMVNQTLNLERVIFLERVKDDHRVREVKSLNCSLQDIKELRRDYERTPYSTAIASRHPIEVEHYLAHGEKGEVQYLVPLLFGGEVQGFWAFSTRPEKLAALRNKDAVLRDFAEQIAELLFHRQQAMEKEARLSRPLQRYLRLQGGEQIVESLEKTLTALDRRMAGMEDYLDGLSTAGILYDLFGRVLIANRQMVQLLSEARLVPYKMTVVDMISAVAGVSLDYARGLMRKIILDREKVSLPAKLEGDERSYILYLSPLVPAKDSQILRDGDPLPFEMEGVLCEMVDVTKIKRLCGLKEDVAERMTYQVRNDTEALLTGLSLLETSGLPEEKRDRVLTNIREKIASLVSVTEQAHTLLNLDVDTSAIERYPINGKEPLLASVEASCGKASVHGIKFDMQLPELVSLVFASPDGLQAVLESVLEVLVRDTVQQGSITMNMEERAGWIVYRLGNQGFGIPNERFQSYLHGENALSTDEFRKLRQSALQVEHWGGKLEGHSEIGVGTRFELKLKAFI